MGTIKLNNIRVYAHHGCLKEESIIGSAYSVDLEVYANLQLATKTDALKDTVDYVHLNTIVTQEMAIRSKLLEHVGQRIINRIFKEITSISKAQVWVSKINPPIGGDVESVSVHLSSERV